MKKHFACVLLCLSLLLGATPAFAADNGWSAGVLVNGAPAAFQSTVYGSTTYVPFYDAVLALRPDAAVVWENGQFVASASDFTMTASGGSRHLVVNGRYLYIPDGIKVLDDGAIAVPARTLATALGAWTGWNDGLELCSGGAPLAAGDLPYDEATLTLLAQVVTHESGNQPLDGKIAVANVMLNRVADSRFPNTLSGVIYQEGQFPGATNATPNAESILACRLALEGANVVPNAYWFNGAGDPCWASRTKTTIAVIGGHAFYG